MGSRVNTLILTLGLCAGAGGSVSAAGLCTEDSIWLRGEFGKVRFSVDIADDDAERAQGLMFVEAMPTSRGMLFVYDKEAPNGVAFWMKNTLIPLDMIFADRNGVVVKVHENAIPGDLTAIPSEAPAQYVLEINGGLAAQMGITPGAQMRHPSIAEAEWPCE